METRLTREESVDGEDLFGVTLTDFVSFGRLKYPTVLYLTFYLIIGGVQEDF